MLPWPGGIREAPTFSSSCRCKLFTPLESLVRWCRWSGSVAAAQDMAYHATPTTSHVRWPLPWSKGAAPGPEAWCEAWTVHISNARDMEGEWKTHSKRKPAMAKIPSKVPVAVANLLGCTMAPLATLAQTSSAQPASANALQREE